MATYSNILARRITRREEPGRATVRRGHTEWDMTEHFSMHAQNINVTGLRPFINLHTGAK